MSLGQLLNELDVHNINMNNRDGMTPLMIYCVEGNLEKVQFLLEHNADVNIGNPINYAIKYSLDHHNTDILDALIARGAKNNDNWVHFKILKKYPLDDVEFIKKILTKLLNAGLNINNCDKNGTILYFAIDNYIYEPIFYGEMIRFFIEKGINVNLCIYGKKSPLTLMITESLPEKYIKLMLDNETIVKHLPIIQAVKVNSADPIIKLLLDAGADIITQNDDGKCALSLAYHMKIRNRFLPMFVNQQSVNGLMKNGQTMLMNLIETTVQDQLEELVKLILKENPNLEIEDLSGKTVLFYLVKQCDDEKILKLLLEAGANVKHCTHNGEYILQHCYNSKIIKIMIKAGAPYKDEDGKIFENCQLSILELENEMLKDEIDSVKASPMPGSIFLELNDALFLTENTKEKKEESIKNILANIEIELRKRYQTN